MQASGPITVTLVGLSKSAQAASGLSGPVAACSRSATCAKVTQFVDMVTVVVTDNLYAARLDGSVPGATPINNLSYSWAGLTGYTSTPTVGSRRWWRAAAGARGGLAPCLSPFFFFFLRWLPGTTPAAGSST